MIDPSTEPGLELPSIQAEEDPPLPPPNTPPDQRVDDVSDSPKPSRRLRKKSVVKFLEVEDKEEIGLETLARFALLDEDFTEETFRKLAGILESKEPLQWTEGESSPEGMCSSLLPWRPTGSRIIS